MKQPDLPPLNKIVPLHDEEPEQGALFDDIDLGSELLTIERDAASGRHTGSTLERRAAIRDEICERLCSGVSLRKLAKIYKVGRNTLAHLVKRMEAAGKMEPLKRRLASKLGTVAELSADLLIERLESGDVQSNVIPIAMGVAMDKKADLEARETEADSGPTEDLDLDALNDWISRLPAKPSDSQSDAKGPNDQ